eukprot:5478440-Prymnesium_polylepis.1
MSYVDHSTRLDCINRPQATHRYEPVGEDTSPAHPHTPQPKQADAFTHIQGSIASAAKARHVRNDSRYNKHAKTQNKKTCEKARAQHSRPKCATDRRAISRQPHPPSRAVDRPRQSTAREAHLLPSHLHCASRFLRLRPRFHRLRPSTAPP